MALAYTHTLVESHTYYFSSGTCHSIAKIVRLSLYLEVILLAAENSCSDVVEMPGLIRWTLLV